MTLEYSSILIEDYETNAAIIRSILLSPKDYVRIEDDYHPDEYRMGMFLGPLNFTSYYLEAGATNLAFDCKPQRWLKSGEEPMSFLGSPYTDAGSNITSYKLAIANNTYFDSKPLIHFEGKGKIEFTFSHPAGSCRMTLDTPTDEIGDYYIDSELQDCYKLVDGEKVSANSLLTVDEFPLLRSGITATSQIRTDTTINTLTITPRWFIL